MLRVAAPARMAASVGRLRSSGTRAAPLRPLALCRHMSSAASSGVGGDGGGVGGDGPRRVRIGCASGFWGDTAVAAPQLIALGRLDFLVFDYLSEITMSLLTAARARQPDLGYAPDFIEAGIGGQLRQLRDRGVRVVSNAGGINPQACAAKLREIAEKQGVPMKIAVVSGDDLSKKDLSALKEMYTGQPLPKRLHSVNAYLGARAIRAALDAGADVVVTGRCADSALALGPLAHAFDWRWDDWDRLAAGSLAGHLLECGAQSTGGISTDWRHVPDWHRIGFPIADCGADGDLIITKPPGTGGRMSIGGVAEQLVYEIGDPRRYLLPDVSCDWSGVQMRMTAEQDGVVVSGARGRPPTDTYKACGTALDGYKATAVCPVIGPAAAEKARRTAEAILARCRDILGLLKLPDFTRTHIQVLGAEETYPDGPASPPGREAVLWLSVSHADKRALQIFGREVAPAGTGMAPGLTGLVGGRPKPSPVLRLVSFLIPKRDVQVSVEVDGAEVPLAAPEPVADSATPPEKPATAASVAPGPCTYRLERVALTRSGDKGDSCNIGVVARSPELYPHLCRELTAARVGAYFCRLLPPGADPATLVERYELPGIHALNFVLHQSLGGGGIASLRPDPQGKGYGQMLLDMEVAGMPETPELGDGA